MNLRIGFLLLWSVSLLAQSQAKEPVTTHEGCVTALPDDAKSFVLTEGDACWLLTGPLATKRLAGRQVQISGFAHEATTTVPQTIVVDGVNSVKASCTQTCTLVPPGQRGLRRKPKAGTQGGTPGI